MKKWVRELVDDIEKLGVTVTGVDSTGSGHTVLRLRPEDRTGKIFIAGSPSDWRAKKNMVSLARRFRDGHDLAVMREVVTERKSTQKPKSKRK